MARHIGEREMLLLIDNMEQVIEAAPDLGGLVESCPNLRLVVTSRELLRVHGEVEYEVLPLDGSESVDLFCLRSGLPSNDTIGELCRRLDDMPLAVELAAARTKALTPEQILGRLAQRLDLFKGGRDADPRQQTLRATIEWSYDLLPAQERLLFARLGVFAGGCTLEAAEQVSGAELDTLQSLVEKSLVRHTGDRFWMLETIRELAVERGARLADAEKLERCYGSFFLELARAAEVGERGPGPGLSVGPSRRRDRQPAGVDRPRTGTWRPFGGARAGGSLEALLALAQPSPGGEAPDRAGSRCGQGRRRCAPRPCSRRLDVLHLHDRKAIPPRLGR